MADKLEEGRQDITKKGGNVVYSDFGGARYIRKQVAAGTAQPVNGSNCRLYNRHGFCNDRPNYLAGDLFNLKALWEKRSA